MRMVVVLPEPFGPSRPDPSPLPTEKSMPLTAVTGPYCLTRPLTSIMVSAIGSLLHLAAAKAHDGNTDHTDRNSNQADPDDTPQRRGANRDTVLNRLGGATLRLC